MKVTPYPHAEAHLYAVPLVETWPFGPLDLTANLPCVEIERAIAHGLPLPQMPTAIPGVTRLKRLRSKSRFRARRSDDGVFRDGERGRVKQWRVANPDKARAHKQNERLANYTRRFVAIDAEGQNYSSADILYDGVRYAQHGTYLWGAAADDGQPPHWLLSPETRGIDKKPLGAIEILDWLLDLPRKFGRAVWAMFSFGYDVAQILRHLPFGRLGRSKSVRRTRTRTATPGRSAMSRCSGRDMQSPMPKGSRSTYGASPIPISHGFLQQEQAERSD